MKIGTALAAKAFGGSQPASQKDAERSFGGILSNVADDAAGQGGVGPAKLAMPHAKTPDAKTPESKTEDIDMTDLKNLVAAAAPVSMVMQASTARSRGATATFTDPGDKAAKPAEDKKDTTGDQTASVLPNASLLALVQIAAYVPVPQTKSAGIPESGSSASIKSTAVAGSTPGTALPGGIDSSTPLVKAAIDPLVSGITLESHLAPVTSTAASLQVGAATAASVTPSQSRFASALQTPAKPIASTVAGASDQIAVSQPLTADSQAGPSDEHAGQSDGRRRPPETIDSVPTPSVAATVGAGLEASLVVPQKATLSAPSLAVADAVTSLASEAAAHAATTSVAPARTMLLQLSPVGLGTVGVRLHLTGHTLDVSLTASEAGTASLLDHDRGALASALGDRDYQLNSLVIQGSDATPTPGGSSASTDSSANRSMSQSAADQQGGGAGRGGARDPSPRQSGSDRGPASPSAAVARGNALFV